MGTILSKAVQLLPTGSGTGESVGNSNPTGTYSKVFPKKTAVAYMLKTIGTYMQKKTAHS